MSNHEIRFSSGRVWCECDPSTILASAPAGGVFSLRGLNDLAHEHIEATERGADLRPARSIDVGQDEGYGTKSAVTSGDTLVNLA